MLDLNVAGLDVGYAKPPKKTNGVGIWRQGNLQTEKRYCREDAWKPIITTGKFDVLAIDGPVIALSADNGIKRNVERLFSMGLFQRRCKPGMSHFGQGLRLREEAILAADKLQASAPFTQSDSHVPQIRAGSAIVEAFPNAFLGVCLSNQTYDPVPQLKRGKKFDWLYKKAIDQKIMHRMGGLSEQEQVDWQRWIDKEDDHELQATIVCTLTALLVAKGHYVAVGDEVSGWFFLPPFSAWTDWAKETIQNNINKLNDREREEVQIIKKSGL